MQREKKIKRRKLLDKLRSLQLIKCLLIVTEVKPVTDFMKQRIIIKIM
jgi:hypothetical protein